MKLKYKILLAALLIGAIGVSVVYFMANIDSVKAKHVEETEREINTDHHNLNGLKVAYICIPTTILYADTLLSKNIGTLQPGDSVVLTDADQSINGFYYSEEIYNVRVLKAGKTLDGCLRGKSLGAAIREDLNFDGHDEIIATHYIDYKPKKDTDVIDDFETGKAEMIVIQGSKTIAKQPFKANDVIDVEEVDLKRSFPGMHFFKVHFGYPACDFGQGQILVTYQDKKLDTIAYNYSMSSAGVFGNYVEFVFPKDSAGQPNQVITIDHHIEYNDSAKQVSVNGKYPETLHTRDTIVYRYNGKRFLKAIPLKKS